MANELEAKAHHEWLGYIQPVGLVVSVPAMLKAQAHVDRSEGIRRQPLIQDLTGLSEDREPYCDDLPAFFSRFLEWPAEVVAGGPGGPELAKELDVYLKEYQETLSPTFAIRDAEDETKWQMLVKLEGPGEALDGASTPHERRWAASPQLRFERLLRENDVAVGLLANGDVIRLVYAPRGETSGHMTFPLKAMCEVAGRPLVAALYMLLALPRMFTLDRDRRLPAVLKESRRYQNDVSTDLAGQVLEALNELLGGFQAADDATHGNLLATVLREAPQEVYGGLLTTLLRLVFILYAEERSLLPGDPVFQRFYSVAGLYERLERDSAWHQDTMDQRYGAWSQLLTLFRLLHDGGQHGEALRFPPRAGKLFDPDAYPFLEGRPHGSHRVMGDRLDPPRVSDGVVYRVLRNLLVLQKKERLGERVSYRALDVEQIGSVYEAMMGFALAQAKGPSIAVRPHHVVVDLNEVLAAAQGNRAKLFKDQAGCEITGQAVEKLKAARSVDDIVAALGKKVSPHTERPLPPGAMYLQPTEERRRSGSHYTPRSLTEPIVRTTFRPIFEAMGDNPRPEQILELKVCDPAMGSGAFLVEACRFLADKLVTAWDAHGTDLRIPPDEDKVLYARRQVAQKCLYGVDKNPFAVDLAKLSLWLVTLAKDHPFTFLDHSLRCGDSLVGLSREQIASFHWAPQKAIPTIREAIAKRITDAEAIRKEIQGLADSDDTGEKARLLKDAEAITDRVKLVGDLVVAVFFCGEKDREREKRRKSMEPQALSLLEKGADLYSGLGTEVEELRLGNRPVVPFHWPIDFPEVFLREAKGFDVIIGNPPFAGKNTLAASTAPHYPDWLKALHEESHGNADLVAHFFRRAFSLVREGGTFGMIATNTIGQGDTRSTGLRWICTHGGEIYDARKRVKWPGGAAVVVSVVHVYKGRFQGVRELNGRPENSVTAFLFHRGGHEDPAKLAANSGGSFVGSYVLGMGFTFDDTDTEGVASPLAEMLRLIEKDPRNEQRIFPYIGGEEINTSPTHAHHRFVINFEDMCEGEARRWPGLMAIVESKVKPERMKLGDNGDARRRKERWWLWGRYTPALFRAVFGLERVLAISQTSRTVAFAFLPSHIVFSHKVIIFPCELSAAFTVLQSRVHDLWVRFFGSSMKDDAVYTPSDCFETFPFPENWESHSILEAAGSEYYGFRADVMASTGEGLTKAYNRFHDPEERDSDILRLRHLHDEMDRAVLDAYGWTDLQPTCDFYLDYEEDEDDDEGLPRKRKKPWRYRWPDEFRDEVLARLLELNRQRAEEEALHGEGSGGGKGGGGKKPRRPRAGDPDASGSSVGNSETGPLFESLTRALPLFSGESVPEQGRLELREQ